MSKLLKYENQFKSMSAVRKFLTEQEVDTYEGNNVFEVYIAIFSGNWCKNRFNTDIEISFSKNYTRGNCDYYILRLLNVSKADFKETTFDTSHKRMEFEDNKLMINFGKDKIVLILQKD
jgi:hypothetical protein